MKLISYVIVVGACFVLTGSADAATIQTLGAGSAVTSADRSAFFNALAVNGTPLSDYSEDGLYIRVDGDSWIGDGSLPIFDPFHGGYSDSPFYYPLDGSQSPVTIETTDSLRIYGVEFLYGNGWTTGDIYGVPWGNSNAWVVWQTFSGGALVSGGQIGPEPILPVGTVLGFYDPDGFDQLLVRSNIANQADPTIQAIALDNLHVQLSPTLIPEAPASMLMCGALGLLAMGRRLVHARGSGTA